MKALEHGKSNSVRKAVLLATMLAASLLLMSLNVKRSVVSAQSCLITDKDAREIPPPPTLPSAGGTFVDPTFCQTIMRVTDEQDGDCHTFYSYWPTFNLDSTMFIYAANEVPKLGHLNPVTFQLPAGGKSNLFTALAPDGEAMATEDAIWSSTEAEMLYGHTHTKLYKYNVVTKEYVLIKDFTAQLPSGGNLWQMSKSIDDKVFAFTKRGPGDPAPSVGFVAWRKTPDTILWNESQPDFDEVQVDKTGRYLTVKALFDGPGGQLNFKAIDMQLGNQILLSSHAPDYAPGHSDNGVETVVGYDDDLNRFTKRIFSTILDPDPNHAQPHAFSLVINLNDWSQASHLSMLADNENWCVVSNYSNTGSDENLPPPQLNPAFRQEIFQAATDGSQRVRRLAHHHSVYYSYYDTPRANISRDGKFIAFTSNWHSTTRRDVFFIKVPPLTDCTYALSSTSQSFAVGGGTQTFDVTPSDGGCSWTVASNNPSWITITSATSVTGSGTVSYSVASNSGGARNGTITVAGQIFTVSQAGVATGAENVIWTDEVNCTISGNTVTKSGGGSGSCDGAASSVQTITSGTGYLEFTATEINSFRYGALTSTPGPNSASALDFAISFNTGTSAEVQENGMWKHDTLFTNYDVFRISLESGVVKYYKNGTLFYTSSKTPSFPLYAKALLCSSSSTITNAKISASCSYTIAPTMQSFGTGGGTGTITVTPNGSSCAWTAVSNNPSWITITSGSPGMGDGSVGYSVASSSGAMRNGTITVAGQTFSVSQAGVQNVIWTDEVNCTISGNTVTKSGGGSGSCDGGALSLQAITSGNGYLEFTATEINSFRYGALTPTPGPNSASALDFAISFNTVTSAEVQENGMWKHDTPFTNNDVFRISLESGVVKYYKNGTLFYTSSKTPSFPLYAKALLCSSGSTITNAVMFIPDCVTIAPNHQSFAASAGTGAINVDASSGCSWTATKTDSWITITSSASGSGNGTVSYSVTANTNSTIRSGIITVNNQVFTVYQGINFTDVATTDPFYNDIGKLSSRGVTLGCGGGNYCPNDSVTRQSMAAFLMRALGEFSPPTPASQRFADVSAANVFYNFIDRIAALNITVGCGGGNYCPADPVTREQMAAFILRALGEFSPPTPPSQRFNDVPSSSGFYNFIDRVAVLQITLGCSQSPPLYCPGDAITRAQMAAFLVRAFNL